MGRGRPRQFDETAVLDAAERLRMVDHQRPAEPHIVCVRMAGGRLVGVEFDEALNLCESGSYTDAMHRFHQLGQDPAARAYADKLAQILKAPEPVWDGVWDLTQK